MQWIVSEDKLGHDQKDVIEEIGKITDKPIWIKGHAGSGKSVLLLHALKDYLARKPTANVCVVVFTRALVDLLSTGLKQIPFLENKSIPVLTIYQMNNNLNARRTYDAIFCDEIQDVPIEIIKQMKNACKHLIIAGDSEQSIYNTVPGINLRPATSNEITSQITPLEKNLTVIYRLTASVLNVLRNVFRSLLTDKTNIAKEDTEIKLYKAKDIQEEIQFCWKEAKQTNSLRSADVSAILLSGHDSIVEFVNIILKIEGKSAWTRVNGNLNNSPDYDSLNRHLTNANVPLMYVGNNYGSLAIADSTNRIIIMTYHSSKGLDFNYVYLPMVNSNMYIHSNINALLLVALSRSKSGLFISFSGALYSGLNNFLTGIKPKTIELTNTEDEIIF